MCDSSPLRRLSCERGEEPSRGWRFRGTSLVVFVHRSPQQLPKSRFPGATFRPLQGAAYALGLECHCRFRCPNTIPVRKEVGDSGCQNVFVSAAGVEDAASWRSAVAYGVMFSMQGFGNRILTVVRFICHSSTCTCLAGQRACTASSVYLPRHSAVSSVTSTIYPHTSLASDRAVAFYRRVSGAWNPDVPLRIDI